MKVYAGLVLLDSPRPKSSSRQISIASSIVSFLSSLKDLKVWDTDADSVPLADLRVCSHADLNKPAERSFFNGSHSTFQGLQENCKNLSVFSDQPNIFQVIVVL